MMLQAHSTFEYIANETAKQQQQHQLNPTPTFASEFYTHVLLKGFDDVHRQALYWLFAMFLHAASTSSTTCSSLNYTSHPYNIPALATLL